MPIVPSPNDTTFAPVPAGNHVAVCYRVIDLGTQPSEFQGKKSTKQKILISWEIPDEKMEDGRPFTIGQRFTWSMSEKASLRKSLESWRGRAFTDNDFSQTGFDIKNILGVGCMLNVVHATNGGKTYANIASVAKLPKGLTPPPLVNKEVYIWLSREEFNARLFEEMSEGLKQIIKNAPEYAAMSEPERITDETHHEGHPEFEEEIPF